ncbi:hypothetical protein LPJ75_004553, partial [Coemansia sp. RSA 2598]
MPPLLQRAPPCLLVLASDSDPRGASQPAQRASPDDAKMPVGGAGWMAVTSCSPMRPDAGSMPYLNSPSNLDTCAAPISSLCLGTPSKTQRTNTSNRRCWIASTCCATPPSSTALPACSPSAPPELPAPACICRKDTMVTVGREKYAFIAMRSTRATPIYGPCPVTCMPECRGSRNRICSAYMPPSSPWSKNPSICSGSSCITLPRVVIKSVGGRPSSCWSPLSSSLFLGRVSGSLSSPPPPPLLLPSSRFACSMASFIVRFHSSTARLSCASLSLLAAMCGRGCWQIHLWGWRSSAGWLGGVLFKSLAALFV